MAFNKEKFIAKKGNSVYIMLLDFVDCEINNNTYHDLKFLLSLENIRSFIYDGNKYVIKKNIDNHMIIIIDEVAENHGVRVEQSRFEIDTEELLDILSDTRNILEA